MKYIVVDHTEIFLFPRHVDHAGFANNNGGADKVTSAGFVEMSEGGLRCVGRSHSLDIGRCATDDIRLQVALKV